MSAEPAVEVPASTTDQATQASRAPARARWRFPWARWRFPWARDPHDTRPHVPARRVLALIWPYRGRMLLAGFFLACTSAVALALPLGLQRLIDTVFTRHDPSLLNVVTLALLALFALRGVLDAAQSYLVASTGQRLTADLRERLFAHLERLSLRYYDERRTGELISRVTSDVSLIQTSLTDNVLPLVGQAVTLVGAIAIVATINWRLTLVVLLVAPPASLVAGGIGRRVWSDSSDVQEALAQATGVLEESLGSVRVVKAFGRQDYEATRFSTQIRVLLRAGLRRARVQALLGPVVGFIGFSAVVAVIWFGGREVLAGRLSIGGLVAFVLYLIFVVAPLAALSGLFAQTQAALAAAARVFVVLDEPVEPAEQSTTLPDLPPVEGRITCEHLAFAYLPGRPVLRDVSFEAAPGQVVAVVGPSGAGKTTLLGLLLRLYERDGGAIGMDGHDIDGVNVASLRAQMAFVPQEPALFSGSVADNIRYGRLDASDAEVAEAARAANAHEFVERLPDGFATLVGERGIKLSAGQRQRIAIARAILRNPHVLLLDEATASLDNASEALVQDALARLMRGRTTAPSSSAAATRSCWQPADSTPGSTRAPSPRSRRTSYPPPQERSPLPTAERR